MRKAPWTVTDYADRERHWTATLALEGKSDAAALACVLEQVAQLSGVHPTNAALLDVLTLNVLALELNGRCGGLNDTEARRLFRDTLILLNGCGIKPGASRLSVVFGRIHKARSADLLRKGHATEAACQFEIARHLVYRPTAELAVSDALEGARLQLAAGAAELALASVRTADGPEARVLEARALRLAGEPLDALELLRAVEDAAPAVQAEAAWEARLAEAAASEDPGPLCLRVLRQPGAAYEQLLVMKLWIYARGLRRWFNAAPRADSLRRRKSVPEGVLRRHRRLYSAVRALDQAYENELPLAVRLAMLSDACASRKRFRSLDAELLVLAACAKHAALHAQRDLASVYLAEYEALSLRLSDGRSKDVLGVAPVDTSAAGEPAPDAPPTGWRRTGKMLALAAQAAGISAKGRVKRALADERARPKLAEQELAELGEALYRHMAEMKGGLMKVGQFLSLASDLPAELRASLALLRETGAPFPPLVVDAELKRAFGDPARVFEAFDETPLAIGSIGQIHRARLRADGRAVAVKVRHPRISEAIRHDLKAMALLKPVLHRMMPAADVDGLLRELSDRLVEETDFRVEARNQADFAAIFADDPAVVIPAVHARLCSESVLVTDYVEGRSYSEFLAAADQQERDAAGQVLAAFNAKALFRGEVFNGDPHPGNYLFLEDGRIAFLDFGCCRRWAREDVRKWLESFTAVMYGDYERFARAMKALGYDARSDRFDMRAHWRLAETQLAPLLADGPFRMSPEYAERVKLLHTQSPNMPYASPPPEFLLLMRVSFGLADILCELGAEARWREAALRGLAALTAREPAATLEAG